MPRECIYTCVFCPTSSPQRRKPGYAALLRIRGNYFRPYLSIPRVCHTEVQHINENSPTIRASSQVKTGIQGTTPEQLILRKQLIACISGGIRVRERYA